MKENFKEKIAGFMSNRHGMDQLNNALTVLILAGLVLNIFIKSQAVGSVITVLCFCVLYRSYSRNISKRTLENDKFMKLWKPLRRKGAMQLRRIRESRTHCFRTCPGCKAVIRMPRKKGSRVIKCPRCQTEFETRIYL